MVGGDTALQKVVVWLVETLHYKTGVLGSITERVLGNFKVIYCFRLNCDALESTQPTTEMSTKEFPWW